MKKTFFDRGNLIALLSLIVAIISFFYSQYNQKQVLRQDVKYQSVESYIRIIISQIQNNQDQIQTVNVNLNNNKLTPEQKRANIEKARLEILKSQEETYKINKEKFIEKIRRTRPSLLPFAENIFEAAWKNEKNI